VVRPFLLFNFDLMSIPIGSPSTFLDSFLSLPASSIPKGAQWCVRFADLEGSILPAIALACQNEPASWTAHAAGSLLLSDSYQKSWGCLFCQAIGIPGEGLTTVPEGNVKSNALIRGSVGAGRNDFSTLRMTFLETNISFCDSFLRGWALATANFGLIARGGEKNYRTALECTQFMITPSGPLIRTMFTFDGVCCVGVAEQELSYASSSAPVERAATFVFNSYRVGFEAPPSQLLQHNKPPALDVVNQGVRTQSTSTGTGIRTQSWGTNTGTRTGTMTPR
jgi:hypothetical protein